MKRVIRLGLLEKYEIYESCEMGLDETCMHFNDKFSTLQFLKRFLNDYFSMTTFRTILQHGLESVDFSRKNDHQVLDLIADKLISGNLMMIRGDMPLLSRLFETETETKETETKEEVATPIATAVVEEKTWIEIQLTDEAALPLADEHYKVILPDGSERTGVTNSKGMIRFDGIDAGNCQIQFSRLDEAAWE